MTQLRVMHYLNQFFAGMGGEDKANLPLDFRKGPIGPGKRLQQLLGNSAEIVVTAYCGDNYFAEHSNIKEVLEKIPGIARDYDVNMFVAGPAFNAGRYGFACLEVCHFLTTSLGLSCVSGMFMENPGVDAYRQFKDKKVFILPTGVDASGMEDALSKMARFVLKLAAGSTIGPASEEGYIPRGLRVLERVSESGAKRGIDMLLNKLAGRPFATEIPMASFEETPIAPPLVNLKDAHLALASTAGVHAEGNPYGCKPIHCTQFGRYPIDKLDSMKDGKWMVLHVGYTSVFMADEPNYGVPLDVCREMEREGVFAKLSPNFYGTTGVGGAIGAMEKIGKEMVRDMKAEGVDGVLLVAT